MSKDVLHTPQDVHVGVDESVTPEQLAAISDLVFKAFREVNFTKSEADYLLATSSVYGKKLRAALKEIRLDVQNKHIQTLVRTVHVDRSRTVESFLRPYRKNPYFHRIETGVAQYIPVCAAGEVELVFFKLDDMWWVMADKIEKEYEARGLISDPLAVLAFSEQDPDFIKDRSYTCQWRHTNGKTYEIGMGCYDYKTGECFPIMCRAVDYYRRDHTWFAGVRAK